MDFGEPSPDVIARLYNEIKEKKVSFESRWLETLRRDDLDSRTGLEKSRKEKSNETTEESRENTQFSRVHWIHDEFESRREQVISILFNIQAHLVRSF